MWSILTWSTLTDISVQNNRTHGKFHPFFTFCQLTTLFLFFSDPCAIKPTSSSASLDCKTQTEAGETTYSCSVACIIHTLPVVSLASTYTCSRDQGWQPSVVPDCVPIGILELCCIVIFLDIRVANPGFDLRGCVKKEEIKHLRHNKS